MSLIKLHRNGDREKQEYSSEIYVFFSLAKIKLFNYRNIYDSYIYIYLWVFLFVFKCINKIPINKLQQNLKKKSI